MAQDQTHVVGVPQRNGSFCGLMRSMNGGGDPPPLLSTSNLSYSRPHLGMDGRDVPLSPGKALLLDERVVRNGLSMSPSTIGLHTNASSGAIGYMSSQRCQPAAPGHGLEPRPLQKTLQDSVPSLMDSTNRKPTVRIDPIELAPAVAPPCSKEKEEFMASLGLITISVYKEIKARRQTRKRRKTAPYAIDVAEQEAKRMRELKDARANVKAKSNGRYFAPLSAVPLGKDRPAPVLKNGQALFVQERDPQLHLNVKTTADAAVQTDSSLSRKRKRHLLFVCTEEHDGLCEVCDLPGELLLCDTCTKAYHFACLAPSLPNIPQGMWICPKCQEEAARTEIRAWPGTISLVRAFTQFDEERDAQRRALEEELQKKQREREELHRSLAALTTVVSTRVRMSGLHQPTHDKSFLHMVKGVQHSLASTPYL